MWIMHHLPFIVDDRRNVAEFTYSFFLFFFFFTFYLSHKRYERGWVFHRDQAIEISFIFFCSPFWLLDPLKYLALCRYRWLVIRLMKRDLWLKIIYQNITLTMKYKMLEPINSKQKPAHLLCALHSALNSAHNEWMWIKFNSIFSF